MSEMMEEEVKRWTARRNSALVLEIIQGKTTEAAASRHCLLAPVLRGRGDNAPSWELSRNASQ